MYGHVSYAWRALYTGIRALEGLEGHELLIIVGAYEPARTILLLGGLGVISQARHRWDAQHLELTHACALAPCQGPLGQAPGLPGLVPPPVLEQASPAPVVRMLK